MLLSLKSSVLHNFYTESDDTIGNAMVSITSNPKLVLLSETTYKQKAENQASLASVVRWDGVGLNLLKLCCWYSWL